MSRRFARTYDIKRVCAPLPSFLCAKLFNWLRMKCSISIFPCQSFQSFSSSVLTNCIFFCFAVATDLDRQIEFVQLPQFSRYAAILFAHNHPQLSRANLQQKNKHHQQQQQRNCHFLASFPISYEIKYVWLVVFLSALIS